MKRLSTISEKVQTLLLTEISRADTPTLVASRREQILANPSLKRRMGALALHHLVHKTSPAAIRHLLELPYARAGYTVLGHGYDTTAVYKPGSDRVVKVVRGTHSLSPEERAERAAYFTHHIGQNLQHHPDVTLPTTVEVGPSPLRGAPSIALVQELAVPSAEPADPSVVKDFAEKSLDEMLPTGYAPDVAGYNNLYNTADGLRLVDTVAINAEINPDVFEQCRQILRTMAHTGDTNPWR